MKDAPFRRRLEALRLRGVAPNVCEAIWRTRDGRYLRDLERAPDEEIRRLNEVWQRVWATRQQWSTSEPQSNRP